MAEEIRYGIIGTGMMGCEHLRNIMEIDDARVTAISDPDEKSRGYAFLGSGQDPDLEIYQDHREMLERAPIDAVVVASPNHTHARVMADILDNAFVIVDYENGCRAHLDLCMFAESSRNEQELVATGSGGKLECFIPDGMMRIGTRKYKDFEEIQPDADERVRYQGLHHGASYLEHLDFLEAIRTGSPPRVTAWDGLLSVAVGIAAHRSIDEGRPVTLEELGLARKSG